MTNDDPRRMTRRTVLRGAAALGLAVFVPVGRGGDPAGAAVVVDGDGPLFLTAHELATLRALVDRFVPGPPEDPDPGAVAAGCAEAIDALLGAFLVDPPRIYAGAPFSDRAGSEVNYFEQFLPLDDYEATAWRLRIEGSGGRPELEFNGPVPGYQRTYRDGLAALDAAAPDGLGFADLPAPARDAILRTSDDPAVAALVDVAFPHTLELLYGPPEYGGNRELVGWQLIGWDGDVQPRGWTREQVEHRDGSDDPLPALPAGLTVDDLMALAPLASTEAVLGMHAHSDGRLTGMQEHVRGLLDAAGRSSSRSEGAGHGG